AGADAESGPGGEVDEIGGRGRRRRGRRGGRRNGRSGNGHDHTTDERPESHEAGEPAVMAAAAPTAAEWPETSAAGSDAGPELDAAGDAGTEGPAGYAARREEAPVE